MLRWEALDACGAVDAVVTTRHGGWSHGPYASLNLGLHVGDDPAVVVRNRRAAASAIGLDVSDLVFCQQTHGVTVATVTGEHRGRGTLSDDDALPATDAVVTTATDIGLVVMVADCVPVVLVDPVAGVLGCAHAGWRGTVANIVAATIGSMVQAGAEASRLVVGIGPAIAGADYSVGADVAEATTRAFGPRASDVLRPDGPGQWHLDLVAANHLALRNEGVAAANIHTTGLDTSHDALFSHRRSQPCGRFAAVARLRP